MEDRAKWNDNAIDQLEQRIRREVRSISGLHERVGRIEEKVDRLLERPDLPEVPTGRGLSRVEITAFLSAVVVPVVVAILAIFA